MILNNSSWIHKNISSPKKQQTLNEARGKKIADPLRAKLMGMEDIRALKGTMTPRYFATKVIRFLQKNTTPRAGLEPATHRLTVCCSYQLS